MRAAFCCAQAAGEEAVRAAAPGATIVRPADVFGPEDRFLNLFARMHQVLPRVPLVDGGRTRVQPLYVEDLARALYVIATVRLSRQLCVCSCAVIRIWLRSRATQA